MSDRVEMVVRTIAQTAIDNEQYFSELDGVVGDGDFGYSLARGFEKVLAEWDTLDPAAPGQFLTKTAALIISAVGGGVRHDLGHGILAGRYLAGDQDRHRRSRCGRPSPSFD